MSAQLHADPSAVRKTALFEEHKKLGARFTEFGGWSMPVQYTGLSDEHLAVRSKAGLFDVSHMGEIFVRGKKAKEFLDSVSTNDVSKLQDGEAQYSLLLNEGAGVIDDIIIYRFDPENYLLCVNAGNAEIDWAWLSQQNERIGASLENASSRFGQIALQGPEARSILAEILSCAPEECSPKAFRAFTFREKVYRSRNGSTIPLIIACTGYTGEDGFELFCPNTDVVSLWQDLLLVGADYGLKPAGLGARDTLRLEACFPLHGHELSPEMNPLCSGLAWVIDKTKAFIGKESLVTQEQSGLPYKLVGLEVVDPGIIREGAKLFAESGESIGWVTSGTKPPTVNKSVALGFVKPAHSNIGNTLKAEVRGKLLTTRVMKKPFYKRQAVATAS